MPRRWPAEDGRKLAYLSGGAQAMSSKGLNGSANVVAVRSCAGLKPSDCAVLWRRALEQDPSVAQGFSPAIVRFVAQGFNPAICLRGDKRH